MSQQDRRLDAPRRAPVSSARRGRTVAVALIVGAVAAATVGLAVGIARGNSAGTTDPFAGRDLYLDPDGSAARAASTTTDPAERAAAAVIAAQPAAIWLTPEHVPAGDVREHVGAIVADAASADAQPVLVVYGIADRDCGGHSAGGLPPRAYLDWVDQIAAGIADRPAAVVLEPDSLAMSTDCADPGERIDLVASALERLDGDRTAVYLDGGHSDWLSVERMADLLRDAGIDRARGFATNVANTRETDDELAYATALADRLGGAHAVIDTSRNGAGPPPDGEWCNARGRALGDAPHVIDHPVVDALLWIKPPGESDGECNGGPRAGRWWPDVAVELAAEPPASR